MTRNRQPVSNLTLCSPRPRITLPPRRWIIDSRDDFTAERMAALDDMYKLYRCKTIMNCAQVRLGGGERA